MCEVYLHTQGNLEYSVLQCTLLTTFLFTSINGLTFVLTMKGQCSNIALDRHAGLHYHFF